MILSIFYLILGGLVFSITLVLTHIFKSNRIINFYLLVTYYVLCVYLILFGLRNSFDIYFEIPNFSYSQLILILTPTIYLFFEKLILNIKFPQLKDFLFYLFPLFLFQIAGNNYIFIRKEQFYFIFFIICNLILIYFIYDLLSRNIWNVKYENLTVVKWASFSFNIMLCFFFHYLIFCFFKFYNLRDIFIFILDYGFLFLALVGYFKIVFTPEFLYGDYRNYSNFDLIDQDEDFPNLWNHHVTRKIEASKDLLLYNKINSNVPKFILIIEKNLLNNNSLRSKNYNLNDLSLETGLPKYYIEFVFKYHCKLSFDSYKRLFRVYDASKLINQGFLKNNTLNYLSDYVGFSSYNPFFISFKQVFGVSPYEFHKQSKVKKISIQELF